MLSEINDIPNEFVRNGLNCVAHRKIWKRTDVTQMYLSVCSKNIISDSNSLVCAAIYIE